MPKSPHFNRARTIPDLISEQRHPKTGNDNSYYKVGVDEPRAIPFVNNWGNAVNASLAVAPLRFYLSDDGEVRMHGHITGGQIGSVICTLPPELRPQFGETFICPLSEGDGSATITVAPSGDVTLINII